MTLHQLRIFLAVARHLSYSRAAEELRLTQPAVSAQVRELERHLGGVFFERVGRAIRLTGAGVELLGYAERVCTLVDEVSLVMEEFEGLKRGRVALASVSTAGAYVLPPLLGAFRGRHPGIGISLEVGNRAICQQRLLQREVDLVVMGRVPEQIPHEAQPFLPDELVIIAAPSHSLARAKDITAGRLAAEPFIFRESGSGTRLNAEEFLRQRGISAPVGLELGDTSAVKEAVAAGLGIALLSRHAIRMELALGRLAVLDVRGLPLRRQWYVVHREKQRLTRVAVAFKAFLLTSAGALLGPAKGPPSATTGAGRTPRSAR
jgi:DNA-binding transcriptional LysR family regulator